MANQFYTEFSTDKLLRIDLDAKYREMKEEISYILSGTNHKLLADLGDGTGAMLASLEALITKVNASGHDRKAQLLADIIHMHLNRTFKAKQRRQEMVTYYLASKFCVSQIAQLSKKEHNKVIAEELNN